MTSDMQFPLELLAQVAAAGGVAFAALAAGDCMGAVVELSGRNTTFLGSSCRDMTC